MCRSSSSWSVLYYIIPLWYENWNHSSENLTIDLYFKAEIEPLEIPGDTFFIKTGGGDLKCWPIAIYLSGNVQKEKSHFLMYKARFDIQASQVEEFELVFTKNIYNCSIPSINYKKTTFDFKGTIL